MTRTSAYRILGIDPGLHTTGYGVVDFTGSRPAIVEAGAIKTRTRASMPERLRQIHLDVTEVLGDHEPDMMAVEKLYAHYAHPRTSILMGHARGVILLAAQNQGVPVCNVPATKVKKNLTGNGHANKRQVQIAVQHLFGLPEPPTPNDVSDAIAIALCAGRIAV
ncbi:MAG: crossover junction endodeoxyribonuclease RuvC [Phycisphaerae bacterium]